MSKLIYDYDDNGLIHTFEDGTAIDANGNIRMRISDDLSVDLATNNLHYTPDWDLEDLDG